MQQPLLKINIVQEFPFNGGTADLKAVGFGDDGHQYALKRLEDGALLPITEWVSYHLCRSVGIQTPDFNVVWRASGDPAFGSRWETNAQQLGAPPTPLRLLQFFQPARSQIESIYAVDAFLPNNDRHGDNILFRPTALGLLPLAYDFSRAWLISGVPFGDMASLTPQCRTSEWWEYLKQQYGYQPAIATLDAICGLPSDWLSNVIEAAPPQWRMFALQQTVDAWINDRQSRKAQAGAFL